MINSYNTSAVYINGLCFLRALCERCVPQRPTSHSVLFWFMKDIPGYEGLYAVTEDGKVWSYKGWFFLKPGLAKWYASVSLCKNWKPRQWRVNRIVALTYLSNPNNYPIVRHLDNNKLNNHVSNLDWCTYSTNAKQAWDDGLNPLTDRQIEARRKIWFSKGIKIAQFKKDWTLIRIYDSARQAAIINWFCKSDITKCAKWTRLTVWGYMWKYSTVNQLIKANKK